MSAAQIALKWSSKKIKPYKKDVGTSWSYNSDTWKNGLGLCALIHATAPDLLEHSWASYVRADSETRVEKVFEIAFKHFCVEPPCAPYDWCTHAEAPTIRPFMIALSSALRVTTETTFIRFKCKKSLGIAFCGTIENGYSVPPVYVKRLVPGGLAESHGVMVGDCLHKINGADVTENYVEEIVQLIKESMQMNGKVEVVLSRPPRPRLTARSQKPEPKKQTPPPPPIKSDEPAVAVSAETSAGAEDVEHKLESDSNIGADEAADEHASDQPSLSTAAGALAKTPSSVPPRADIDVQPSESGGATVKEAEGDANPPIAKAAALSVTSLQTSPGGGTDF